MSGDQKEAMNRVGYLLSQTLKSTSEEVRSAAETQLKFYAKQDGFLLILLCIVGQQGSPGDTSLQQSAAIYFKNTMMKRWPPGYNEEKEAAALNEEDGTLKYLSIQDQQLLRDQILPVYFQANASIR